MVRRVCNRLTTVILISGLGLFIIWKQLLSQITVREIWHQEVGIKSRINTSPASAISTSPFCIEDNICKTDANGTYYFYKRKPGFMQRIDAKISPHINITHSEYVVPNIVHFVQYTNLLSKAPVNDFQFHHMLSVLSAYKIQKPERIYFWLDQEPQSKYWVRLKQMVSLYLIIRERPQSIRGRKISFVTQVSNVIRMEAIIEYGGMYFDLDVLVVKPLDDLRRYDVTMGKEEDVKFCNAIIIARPWADFLRKWHQEHISLNERVWSYHSGKVPYLVSRQFPSIVHVEERSFFRPAYDEMDDLYKEGQLYDWRRNNYCVHLWINIFRGKRRTDSEIDTWNTTVGEMYRFILYDDWRIRI